MKASASHFQVHHLCSQLCPHFLLQKSSLLAQRQPNTQHIYQRCRHCLHIFSRKGIHILPERLNYHMGTKESTRKWKLWMPSLIHVISSLNPMVPSISTLSNMIIPLTQRLFMFVNGIFQLADI
ncbi:hypothetical protein CDL12_14571 [Handroanthus impetiginosus]|uniref:Uncharacterized protein n=1 Tax=Handroanthus impetiginosus TaxID=429701 RepID=A0A2G9H5M0_9LAMI|nr:hypothetical protein CDL12_14571 [Handroanthus impetiginosus]